MDMTLNDDQKALQENVRRIGERIFAPFEGRWESEPKCAAEALKLLGQHRLLGLNLPEAYGGVGLGNLEAALCVEEMAKHSPDAGLFMAAASLGQAYYIHAFGTEEQRRKFLPAICAGAFTTAIAITEPGAGTAATGMTTKAAISGDKIVINGRKHYVSNAGLAGVFIVYARLGTTRGAKGIGAILVERDAPGFKIERMSENMAGGFQADLVFDDCAVPATNLLMGEGAF